MANFKHLKDDPVCTCGHPRRDHLAHHPSKKRTDGANGTCTFCSACQGYQPLRLLAIPEGFEAMGHPVHRSRREAAYQALKEPTRLTAAEATEDEKGTFVYWSEYEALVEAFALYAEEGMDDAAQIFGVLEPHLGEKDARFVADMVGEAMTEDPNDKAKREAKT